MTVEKCITLKEGKEKAIRNHHHWIFSGAILNAPSFVDGDILPVRSFKGELLGSAYFNRQSKIIGRMVCFDSTSPLEAIKTNMKAAIKWRCSLFKGTDTNAYRLINGEGDGLPGLIVDQYNDVLVLQIGTLGFDRLRSWIVDFLVETLQPRAIYEKSLLPSRKEECLEPKQGVLFGSLTENVTIMENGLQFSISIPDGQKTGFFLDHREMRQWVKELALNKRVLNCFSYTGAFTAYALAGHALSVDSVDISEQAISQVKHNLELNKLSMKDSQFLAVDAFQFLRENPLNYDLIILDPPAFAKRQKDIIPACRGYKDINRLAISKMPPGSLLLTSSCSYHVDEALFQKVLFQASIEAKRKVQIIGRHRIAPDHPINICHPESDYLKSFLLHVE